LDGLSRVVVGGSVTEATATVTLLSNDSAGAQAGVEATAARGAVGVAGARTRDELRTRSGAGCSGLAGASGVVGGSGCSAALGDARSGLRVGTLNSLRGVVVGGSVTKAAPTVALLSDDGASTFATVETAAAGCAIRVARTWAGDELGAGGCARDERGSREVDEKETEDDRELHVNECEGV